MASLLDSPLPVTSDDSDDSVSISTEPTLSPIGPVIPSITQATNNSPSLTPSSIIAPSNNIMSTTAPSANTKDDDGPKSGHSAPAGLIVGIIILILAVTGLALFFIRRHFIRQRGQKTTATRARLSRVGGITISGPTNFQHLGTGTVNVSSGAGGATQISGFTVSNHQAPSSVNLREEDTVWDTEDSPNDRIKPKQSYDFGALESGLSDHVETMKKQRSNRI